MGLKPSRFSAVTFFLFGFAVSLPAAPMLRLAASTVGPVSIAVGANGAPQTVEAFNAGDGTLSLALSSSASWLAASVGAPRACSSTTQASACIPLQFALNTASLAAGTYTGIVTVSDPNAADAPQTITVTVADGGAVPAAVDAYVAPGGSRDIPFTTNVMLFYSASTTDRNPWLSVALDGVGTFRFVLPYRIHLQPPAAMDPGTYTGTVLTGGSSFAPDNKTIPVTMRVTSLPIAQAAVDRVSLRLAQGAPPQTAYIPVSNLGQGSLVIQTVSASGGDWMKASAYAGGAALAFDTGSLAPGTYSGTVTIATNAVNTLPPVPVDFQVVAKGAPTIPYQGVLDNAIFAIGDAVTGGDIVDVFGEQLSFNAPASGTALPLTRQIGTTRVLVNGQPAPLFYASYGQIDFQLPTNLPTGTALVQVERDGQAGNAVSIQVAARAPRFLVYGPYAIAVNFTDGSFVMPSDAIPGLSHPAKAGDTLTIYAIGLGPTKADVNAGDPAPYDPLPELITTPIVNFGGVGSVIGVSAMPSYAGLSPGSVGLYQVNVTIPPGVSKGVVNVVLTFPDSVSNVAQIAIQ